MSPILSYPDRPVLDVNRTKLPVKRYGTDGIELNHRHGIWTVAFVEQNCPKTAAATIDPDSHIPVVSAPRSKHDHAMCNHYRTIPERIADWAEWAGYRPSRPIEDNVWPKRVATVARIDAGAMVPDDMHWGVPFQTTTPTGRPTTKFITNVRNLSSPFWRSMLNTPTQRCLVPFTSFAEPKPGKDPSTGRPAEWWFSMSDGSVGAFAGIWRESEAGRVFAFLTCAPNPLVAPLHPKAMPVILHQDDYRRWLEGNYDDICALAVPYPSQLMQVA